MSGNLKSQRIGDLSQNWVTEELCCTEMYCGVFPGRSDGKESACSALCTLLDRMLCNGK